MESNNLSKKMEILEFLFELGATEAHENEPINRLRLSEEEGKSSKATDLEKSLQKMLGPSSFNSQRNTFDELIENATTVHELESICANSKEFSSAQLSDKMNFSFGNHLAKVMVICEPPGRLEIAENVIYAGDRGLIFKKMYEAIGLSVQENNLYVAPIFPWRLSPNPDSREKDMRLFICCVKKHISIVRPKVLVSMYKECDNLENLIIDNKKLYKDVETQVDLTKFSIETPARLLEFPNEKRVAWETLKNIREILKKINE